MSKNSFGNEKGVDSNGTTTINGKTSVELEQMNEATLQTFTNGEYYHDPEGTLRQTIPGLEGDVGFYGSTHGIAHYENGRIVSISGGGAPVPGVGGNSPRPSYADEQAKKAAGKEAAKAGIEFHARAIQALSQDV